LRDLKTSTVAWGEGDHTRRSDGKCSTSTTSFDMVCCMLTSVGTDDAVCDVSPSRLKDRSPSNCASQAETRHINGSHRVAPWHA
jgi:hypothetical protein